MKRHFHGIVTTRDGGYTLATVVGGVGGWRLKRVRTWGSSPLRNAMLLGLGVSLGLESHWRKGEATSDDVIAEDSEWHGLSCTTHAMHLETHTNALEGNIIDVVPEESYLASIPQALDRGCPDTFMAVHSEGADYEIGLVHEGVLRARFRMAPASPDALEGHLGRIERYAALPMSPGEPRVVYWLDHCTPPALQGIEGRHAAANTFGEAASDAEGLRALGVALSSALATTTHFAGQTERSFSRHFRAAAQIAAAALLALTVVGTAVAFAADGILGAMLEARRSRYESILTSNDDIRRLRENSRELGLQILQLRSTLAKQTNWSAFLELLGTTRPSDLSFVQLGSEPVAEDKGRMRIALMGWAEREAEVTTFISRLQRSAMLGDVSLASLERESPRMSRFKVECILRLYASSGKSK